MSSTNISRPDAVPVQQAPDSQLRRVVGYQLAQATSVTDAIFRKAAGTPLELRPVEYTVLTLVAENGGISPAQLARTLAVTPPNITAIIDRLVARGLVLRKASKQDRRSQVLAPTSAGARLARNASERILAAERAMLSLSAGEQAILLELLQKVAFGRDRVRQADPPPG